MSVGTSPMPFSQIQHLVESQRIQLLTRSQECLDKYNNHKIKLKSQGIDMVTYLIVHELGWCHPDTPLSTPSQYLLSEKVKYVDERCFASDQDVTITRNSFPYYVEDDATHLCVWVKSPILPDPNSPVGDIPDLTKKIIECYIQKTFVEWLGIPRENLTWFKNWAPLQSIKSIPHIHVIIKGADKLTIDKVVGTGGIALKYSEMSESKL